MKGFARQLRGEWYLLCRSRAVWAACFLSMAFAAGRIALFRLQSTAGDLNRAVSERAVRGRAGAAAADPNAYGPFADGLSSGFLVAFLSLTVLSSLSIALDRERGTIRLPLVRGTSRSGLVLGKFAALILAGMAMLGAATVCAAASAEVFFDFGPVVEDKYEIFSEAVVRREVLTALGAAAITMPAAAALGLFVSALARSGAAAVAVGLLATVGFDVFEDALGRAAGWVFLSYAPSLLDGSLLKEVSKLARGYSDAGFSSEKLWLNFAVPLPEAALLLGLTLWTMDRRRL